MKLIGGFVLVAAITLAVGYAGWNSVSVLGRDLEEVGNVRLPAVENLGNLAAQLHRLRVATRTLLNPMLNKDIRKRQYDNLASALGDYQKSFDRYDKLPKTAAEARLWQQLGAADEELKKANEEVQRQSRELEKMDVTNPLALRKDLEIFRGDHYQVVGLTLNAILTKAAPGAALAHGGERGDREAVVGVRSVLRPGLE